MTAKRTLKRDWLRKELAWAKAHPHSIKTTRYRIVTPTLRRLERAAMQWYADHPAQLTSGVCMECTRFFRACAAHAQSQAGGKRGRK